MEIKSVAIIGAGTMGRQIALDAAIHGYTTALYARRQEVCDEVEAWKESYLAGRIQKGRLSEEQVAETKGRFRVSADLADAVKNADCVIECIREVESEKRELFQKLDKIVGKDVILATNSSYMVSSQFADCVSNPSRLANAHYYNPALVMKFVEVVQGAHTSDETAETLMKFCQGCGKDPIWMKKEISGFAANRIMKVVTREARYMVENGYLTPQEMDKACEEGLNYPMGPFRLNDLTGIDLTYDMLTAEYEKTGIKPDCYDIYEKMVKEGRLGKKVGHGFYDYE